MFKSLKLETRLHRTLNGLGMCYTNLGQYDSAVKVLREAALVAERTGDTIAAANACSNLGAVYSDLGMFDEAAHQFRSAMAAATISDNARVPTAIYCNASALALMLGSFNEVQELLKLAEQSAKRSRIWQHKVSTLLNRADLNLALEQPEIAWPLVEEAIAITRGRVHLVPDPGQYWRLLLYLRWSTQSRDLVALLRLAPWATKAPVVLAHRLQLGVFSQWIADKERQGADPSAALQDLLKRGLFGVLARLAATKVVSDLLPESRDAESSAHLIARAFSDRDFGTIPDAIRRDLVA